jgi:hypothetical protein
LHVPELHPDKYARRKEAFANALDEAAPQEGAVSHDDTAGSVRFGFAHVVSVQMLPWDGPNVMKHRRRGRLALGAFGHEAVETTCGSKWQRQRSTFGEASEAESA